MRLKIAAVLLVLCIVCGNVLPHTGSSAYDDSLSIPVTDRLVIPEIEPDHDDTAAAETVAAVVIIVLVVCVVIYIAGNSDKK